MTKNSAYVSAIGFWCITALVSACSSQRSGVHLELQGDVAELNRTAWWTLVSFAVSAEVDGEIPPEFPAQAELRARMKKGPLVLDESFANGAYFTLSTALDAAHYKPIPYTKLTSARAYRSTPDLRLSPDAPTLPLILPHGLKFVSTEDKEHLRKLAAELNIDRLAIYFVEFGIWSSSSKDELRGQARGKLGVFNAAAEPLVNVNASEVSDIVIVPESPEIPESKRIALSSELLRKMLEEAQTKLALRITQRLREK